MVCASVREDNPRASASGLSPVQTHEPYSNYRLFLTNRITNKKSIQNDVSACDIKIMKMLCPEHISQIFLCMHLTPKTE